MPVVSIFGAHFTGKTTLAKKLAELAGLSYFQTDQSMQIAQEMGIDNLDQLENDDLTTKWNFQSRMLKCLSERGDNTVSDGNPISCLAYGRKLLGADFDSQQGIEIINEAKQNSSLYDFIFYLPLEFDFEQDEFRHSGSDFRKQVAKTLLNSMERPYYVLTGSVIERAQTALYVMNKSIFPARYKHVVFEGICNSGKSTILKMIEQDLQENGIGFYHQNRISPPDKIISEQDLEKWYAEPEYYKEQLIQSYLDLFSYSDQSQDLNAKVGNGELVFSDRHKFSVIALGLGLGYELDYLYRITSHIKTAGTIIFFDLPYQEGVRRAHFNSKSMPSIRQNERLQKMMSDGFKRLAAIHAEVHVVDAIIGKERLFIAVKNIIDKVIS